MKKRITLALMTGLCMAALAACGNGNAAKVETGTETSETASAAAESETETETETEAYYAYNYDLDSLVTLGDYKGLTYEIADTTVTDDEIETEIGYKLKESDVERMQNEMHGESAEPAAVAADDTMVGGSAAADEHACGAEQALKDGSFHVGYGLW